MVGYCSKHNRDKGYDGVCPECCEEELLEAKCEASEAADKGRRVRGNYGWSFERLNKMVDELKKEIE